LPPIQGLALAKDVEQFKPYFLEDLFTPEDNDYFRLVREQTSTPIAMGELYSNPQEIVPMIKDRLIDFIRVHISTIGGLTPARKLAALCEPFNVRTAWHGPADISPVGFAANLMLDMNVWNFGIQEASAYLHTHETLKEVFPGTPEVQAGYMWPNEKPGLGVDIDEELAARYPPKDLSGATKRWGSTRRADGTVIRP
jgi:mannonate dehydratase